MTKVDLNYISMDIRKVMDEQIHLNGGSPIPIDDFTKGVLREKDVSREMCHSLAK